jgi:hypothetical protein
MMIVREIDLVSATNTKNDMKSAMSAQNKTKKIRELCLLRQLNIENFYFLDPFPLLNENRKHDNLYMYFINILIDQILCNIIFKLLIKNKLYIYFFIYLSTFSLIFCLFCIHI